MAPGRKPAACCGRRPATPVTTRKIIVTPQDGSRRQQPHTRDDDRGLPPAQSTVMPAVPPAAIGKASGTFNTLRQLGGVFGVAIGAATFAARGGYASPAAFTAGLGPATGVCAGPALAGAVAGLGTASRGRRAASSQSVPHPVRPQPSHPRPERCRMTRGMRIFSRCRPTSERRPGRLLPSPDRALARCPLSRDHGPGPGQGPSPRLTSRHARPVRGPSPRHRSRSAGLPPSRRPGTSWTLRTLRKWPFFLALAQYPATNRSCRVSPALTSASTSWLAANHRAMFRRTAA